jgi:hypothetical protein
MIKGFVPMLSDNLDMVNDYLTGYLSGIELLENESRASILCAVSKTDEKPCIMVCALDNRDTVVRLISKQSVTGFITQLLKQI